MDKLNQSNSASDNLNITFIGPDSFRGGEKAGMFLGRHLSGFVRVAVLEGVAGTDAALKRKRGFEHAIARFRHVNIVASLSADWDFEKGRSATHSLLEQYPTISAIFACNDEMALGAIRAISEQEKTKNIDVIGYDAIDEALQAIERGEMLASISQQPHELGKLGVSKMVDALKGKKIERSIITELTVVTKENVHDFHKTPSDWLNEVNHGYSPKGRNIGFVFPTLDNPYFVEMAHSAYEEARKNKNITVLAQAPESDVTDVNRQIQIVETMIEQNIDGLLLVPSDSRMMVSVVHKAHDAKIPVIILDNPLR